ncbi:MAG: septum formation protein Maf [Lachnospiraceae bacterium]|nr:septum formation protein Maf [Lachnospiraceae bacterium]
MYKIYLASKSPRRKELMTQIGYEFDILVSERDEVISGTEPEDVVKELSMQKAYEIERILLERSGGKLLEAHEGYDGVVIIGADTVVSYEGAILGKPADEDDAYRMLSMIQGRTHKVSTGVAIVVVNSTERKVYNFAETTDVHMYEMSDEDIREYISTGEGVDKAGSYAIQGIGAKYIKGIAGDYNNVVGLPIGRIYQTLKLL